MVNLNKEKNFQSQQELIVKTTRLPIARENEQVMIGFSFTFDWLRK